MNKSLVAALISLTLCSQALAAGGYQARREAYLKKHPDLATYYAQCIMRGDVALGMTPSDVEASLGGPEDIESSEQEGAYIYFWKYGSRSLTFVNGKLKQIDSF
jgi:hypothetical protein